MNTPKSFKFGLPVLKLNLDVEYEEIYKLNSFEKYLFQLIQEFQPKFEELSECLPMKDDFLRHFISEYEKLEYITFDPNFSLQLTTLGLCALEDQQVNKIRTAEIGVIFDPFNNTILGLDSIHRSSEIDLILEAKFQFSARDLEEMIDRNALKNLLYEQGDLGCVVTRFYVTERKIFNLPVLISANVDTNRHFLVSYFNGKNRLDFDPQSLIEKAPLWGITVTETMIQFFDNLKSSRNEFFSNLMAGRIEKDDFISQLATVPIDQMAYSFLKDEEHSPKYLTNLILRAKKEIYISSGWINSVVVDQIYPYLEEKLKQDVKVILMYGYDTKENASSPAAVQKLLQLAKVHKNLRVENVDDKYHQKGVVIDESLAIIGSYNWLSNSGRTSKEGSGVFINKSYAIDMKRVLFDARLKTAA